MASDSLISWEEAKVKKAQANSRPDFKEVARELGCDPDDPRVAEVLKAMAQQSPKPHGKGADTGDREKKPKKG